MHSRLFAYLERLADFQLRRPVVIIAVAILSLLPAGYGASRLTLKTEFTELLPDNKPSVVEMRRVEKRLPSSTTLTVVALGDDVKALQHFVDALAPRLRGLPPSEVVSVDAGTREARAFFEKNKHLYANLKDIQQIHDDVVARYDYEVSKKTGFDLDFEDEEAPPKIDVDEIEARFEKRIDEAKKNEPGTDGYYIGGKDRLLAAVIINTPLSSGSSRAFELRRQVERVVEDVNPKRFDPNIVIGYTGSIITSAEQQRAVTSDLAHVGVWGVALILGVVFLFFLKIRTLLCMTLTIATGCVWAFGLAALTVGYLNAATGFLVSIIAGNGVNFGIIYMARYMEARRDEHLAVPEALRVAHRETHMGTLAAASAAMVAYGSLASTDFRGFKHFGIISAGGMILCWVATYFLLPAILVLSERISPMFQGDGKWESRARGVYGYPFAWLARRYPRVVTVVGLAGGIASGVLTVRYFLSDPMEYNYRTIRNDRTDPTEASVLSSQVDGVVGRLKQDGKAILVERMDQVKPLVAELARRRDTAPEDARPFGQIVSIYDFLPKDQDKKIALLKTIEDRIQRARKRNLFTDDEWKRLSAHIPEKLERIEPKDLPEQIARPFTEKDGARGRIVYLAPRHGVSVYDMKYVMQWADSFREVRLPSGEIIRGTGSPVIFSDMIINVAEDAPRAILLSLVGTVLVIMIAFRGRLAGVLALGALLLGVFYLVAFLSVENIKLNFLNFVALPISIGVGADYALNVMKRREIEDDANLYRVFVETGGAVVLCSLTTTLGYTALLFSINGAVRTFGLAAAAGEITTLLSAMLILPAVLFWMNRRSRAASTRSVEQGQLG